MDFALSEEQQAIVDLAARILTDRCTLERLKEVEAGSEVFDRDLWAEFAKTDLLGVCLPESMGGGGFGFLDLCLVLREVGRTVAPIPLGPVLVAAQTIAEFGTEQQATAWIPGIIAGDKLVVPALAETDADARAPHLQARAAGSAWNLTGHKTTVSGAHLADALLVSAVDDGGVHRLFIVPANASGLTIERQDTFNHEPQSHVTFDAVAVSEAEMLGGAQGTASDGLPWLIDRATVALCAIAAGVADRGMRITAEYVTGRQQFDRPIGSFQAVGHRMADCFVDNEATNLSMLQAATHLDEGRQCDDEVALAKYWASYSGSRIGHADLHLHGGISIDLDYPIHRYFLWSKHLEFQLGAATQQLARLGADLAATPV